MRDDLLDDRPLAHGGGGDAGAPWAGVGGGAVKEQTYRRWKIVEEHLTLEMVALGQRIEHLHRRIRRLEIMVWTYNTVGIALLILMLIKWWLGGGQ